MNFPVKIAPTLGQKYRCMLIVFNILFHSIDRNTQSGIYNKWKKDTIKSSGYTGNFEERKLDITEQFEFVEISIVQVQAEIYILMFGILIATIVLFIEFCLQKYQQLMSGSPNNDNEWVYVRHLQLSIQQIKLVYN